MLVRTSLGYAQQSLMFMFTVLILFVNFLHNFAFNAGTFYLSLYFQVSKLA